LRSLVEVPRAHPWRAHLEGWTVPGLQVCDAVLTTVRPPPQAASERDTGVAMPSAMARWRMDMKVARGRGDQSLVA
jgi:hypothetical protein